MTAINSSHNSILDQANIAALFVDKEQIFIFTVQNSHSIYHCIDFLRLQRYEDAADFKIRVTSRG